MAKRVTALLAVLISTYAFSQGCNTGDRPDINPIGEVAVAVTPWPGSGAVYVALENGYFEDEGVGVTLQAYVSGHLGLDASLSGKADLATAGDTPIARAIVQRRPVAILATLCEINRAVVVVARKDRGITKPGDLRGKRVGVVEGTTADFFLRIFLTTSYVKPENVGIVGLKTEAVVDALIRGEVDAVSTWSPHTIEAMEKLGDGRVVFDDPGIYKMTWNIVSSKGCRR